MAVFGFLLRWWIEGEVYSVIPCMLVKSGFYGCLIRLRLSGVFMHVGLLLCWCVVFRHLRSLHVYIRLVVVGEVGMNE